MLTFVALLDVNVVQDLAVEYLVKLGCKLAVIILDMDTYNVVEVKKLKDKNICVVQKTWFDIYQKNNLIKIIIILFFI